MLPHLDRVALNAEPDSDVFGADGFANAGHELNITCNAVVDKCHAASYTGFVGTVGNPRGCYPGGPLGKVMYGEPPAPTLLAPPEYQGEFQ